MTWETKRRARAAEALELAEQRTEGRNCTAKQLQKSPPLSLHAELCVLQGDLTRPAEESSKPEFRLTRVGHAGHLVMTPERPCLRSKTVLA